MFTAVKYSPLQPLSDGRYGIPRANRLETSHGAQPTPSAAPYSSRVLHERFEARRQTVAYAQHVYPDALARHLYLEERLPPVSAFDVTCETQTLCKFLAEIYERFNTVEALRLQSREQLRALARRR